MFDGKAFGQEIVAVTKAFVERALAPIVIRLNAIERTLAEQPKPRDEEAALAHMREIWKQWIDDRDSLTAEQIKTAVADAIAALPPAEPGKDTDPAEIDRVVTEKVVAAIATIPVPKDGNSVKAEDVLPALEAKAMEAIGAELSKLPSGDDISALAESIIKSAIEAMPKPRAGEPGKSVTVDDVAPLIATQVEKAVAALPKPKDGNDGIGLAGAVIGRDGNLVITMTDGSIRDLGRVVGADGKDGLSASDFKIEWTQESDREISVTCSAPGSVSKSVFRFPVVLDCGVFKEGQTYQPGDGVTFAGSFWIAQAETAEKPDGGKGWRLAVKRGRDGKDGRNLGPVEPAQKVPLK